MLVKQSPFKRKYLGSIPSRSTNSKDKIIRYIVKIQEENVTYYLTGRRNIGSQYVNRSGWSADMDDAKVFQNKSAATTSGRANMGWQAPGIADPFEAVPVELKIKE